MALLLATAIPAFADQTIVYTGTQVSILPPSGSSFTSPGSMALDLSGNLYIANGASPRVLKVAAGQTTAAAYNITGVTIGAAAQIAVSSSGTLYIADSTHSEVFPVLDSGVGAPLSTGSFTLSHPAGVAVDANGSVYISDTGNSRIIEVHSGGSVTLLATSSGFDLTTLTGPTRLATDTFGNLYACDGGDGGRVIEVTTAGVGLNITSSFSAYSAISTPIAVTVDTSGVVYILDNANPSNQGHRVAVIDPQGDQYDLFLDLIDLSFGTPHGIAADSKGAFYISSSSANTVNLFHQGSADFGPYSLAARALPKR